MTTEPLPPQKKKRRISALDCAVGALAIASLAAPFAARLQVQAHAAAPQVAQPGEVSPIRPIDLALGYEEERAEAAFFQALEEPAPLARDTALDIALVVPTQDTVPAEPVVEREPEIVFQDDLTIARYIQPRPSRTIAVVRTPVMADTAPEPDPTDLPPSADVDREEDLVANEDVVEEEGIAENDIADDATADTPAEETEVAARAPMTAPPTESPLPRVDPRTADDAEETEDTEVAELDEEQTDLPIDVTPPADEADASDIEEAPLPPLDIAEEPVVDAPLLAITEPLEVQELPDDVTPDLVRSEAPVVTRQDAPTPARPAAKITNGPRIAIVIAAAGLNENVTRFAIEALPEGVTLAFAPVKAEASVLAQEAKDDGHTVLVEIPMEPVNRRRDPGPLTLRVGDTPSQNIGRLEKALARVPAADGASSYLGARFNADERAAAPFIASLAERGLFFFENEPTARSVFQRLASRAELPYARGIVKIDRDRNGSAIRDELDKLERQARQRGFAVGVGTSLRGTISTVALWAKEAEKRGVRLVPVTEVGRK